MGNLNILNMILLFGHHMEKITAESLLQEHELISVIGHAFALNCHFHWS